LIRDVEARDQTIAEGVKREAVLVSARGSGDVREEELTAEIARLHAVATESTNAEQASKEATLTETQTLREELADAVQREAARSAEKRDSEDRQQQLHAELNELKLVTEEALAGERARTDDALRQLALEKARVDDISMALVAAQTSEAEVRTRDTATRSDLERLREAEQHRADQADQQLLIEQARAKHAEERATTLQQAQSENSTREQQIREEVERLKQVTDESIKGDRARADQATKRLEEVEVEMRELKKREATLLEAKEAAVDREQYLTTQVQQTLTALAKLEADKIEASVLKANLAAETEAKDAALSQLSKVESDRQADFAKLRALDIDTQALRQTLDTTRQELASAEERAALSSEQAVAVAQELAQLQTSIAAPTPRARHTIAASDPLVHAAGIDALRVQALTSASTGEEVIAPRTRLSTREGEEIDRLEKIIEAQQVIIDDQKERIKFWARVSDR